MAAVDPHASSLELGELTESSLGMTLSQTAGAAPGRRRGAQLPLYQQICLVLQNKIMEREYREGEFLPGEREIEQMFAVSRITAVRALNELALRGLAVRERGRGTRVRFVERGRIARGPVDFGSTRHAARVGTVADFVKLLADRRSRSVEVHRFEYIPASHSVAAALGLRQGDIVQHAERVWRLESRPFSHLTTYVPADVGKDWSRAELAAAPLTLLLSRAGIAITRIEERITAILADHTLSLRLDVDLGAPLIKIVRTAYEKRNRAVEYVVGAYSPERYQYVVSITRERASVSGPRASVRRRRIER
jgi:GntR family transcriptional regulator